MLRECLFILVALAQKSVAKKCRAYNDKPVPYDLSGTANDLSDGEYLCPGPQYPATFTECCWSDFGGCCPAGSPTGYDPLTILSMVVMIICLIIIVATIVNCFWTKGWCYNCCRVNYRYSDVPMYSEQEKSLHSLMPLEANGTNRYDPVKVRVIPIEDT